MVSVWGNIKTGFWVWIYGLAAALFLFGLSLGISFALGASHSTITLVVDLLISLGALPFVWFIFGYASHKHR